MQEPSNILKKKNPSCLIDLALLCCITFLYRLKCLHKAAAWIQRKGNCVVKYRLSEMKTNDKYGDKKGNMGGKKQGEWRWRDSTLVCAACLHLFSPLPPSGATEGAEKEEMCVCPCRL